MGRVTQTNVHPAASLEGIHNWNKCTLGNPIKRLAARTHGTAL